MARTRSMALEWRARLKKLQQQMKRRRLDAMIVFDRTNTYYLTGLRCSLSYLLITPREAVLLVDGRYIETAREKVRHCEVRLLRDWRSEFEKWRRACEPRRIGFEGSAPWAKVEEWRRALGEGEWIESDELIHKMRLIKSTAEIERIARSARINDQVYEAALAAVKPGITEADIARVIRAETERLGAQNMSFDSIVAAGAMSSRPHYESGQRRLEAGDLLLIDMGVVFEGYCSDMTRVVALGRKPKPRLTRLYAAVLAAQEAALKQVRPGIACAELDAVARNALKARRLGRYFTHGLGHGVGLEIHEGPALNARSKQTLRAGMIVTIEPGAYLPGLGGVRIEDLVVVTRKGCRVLSRTPKNLRIIPF